MPFTIVVPVIPKIDVVVMVSGIPTKLVIISPGGRAAITSVIAKNAKKAIAKTTAFDMLTNMFKTFILFLKLEAFKNKQTGSKSGTSAV